MAEGEGGGRGGGGGGGAGGGRGGGEGGEAPQKADVPGIDEARGAPPLPRSPYLGRSTPNAADTAHGEGERTRGWQAGRQAG